MSTTTFVNLETEKDLRELRDRIAIETMPWALRKALFDLSETSNRFSSRSRHGEDEVQRAEREAVRTAWCVDYGTKLAYQIADQAMLARIPVNPQ